MVNNHRKPSNPMVAPKYVATTLFDRQWTTQWTSDPKNVRKQSKAMVPQQKKTISFYRSKISLSLQFIWRKNSFATRKTGNVGIKVETVLICKIWHSHGNIHFWTWMGGFCVISHNRKLLEYWGKKIGSNNQNFNETLSCYSFIPLILLVV